MTYNRGLHGIWNCAVTRSLVVPTLLLEMQGLEGVVSVREIGENRAVAVIGGGQGYKAGEVRIDFTRGEGVFMPYNERGDVPAETLKELDAFSRLYGVILSNGKLLADSDHFLDDSRWRGSYLD